MNIKKRKAGGLLEILVAMGIFVVIASAGVSTILVMNKSNRIGSEDTKATLKMQEGYEALRAIKKKDWNSLTNGAYGLVINGGSWILSGTSDISDGYTRAILIESASRDVSNNIVETGGTVDPNTKKITETISWEYSPGNVKNISNTFYISNWERSINTGTDGMLVYADYSGSDDVIKYKLLQNGTWGSEQTVPDFNVPANRNTRRVELY